MARFFKKRFLTKGKAPGTPIFIGEKKVEKPHIRAIDTYRDILTSQVNIYHSNTNTRLNEIIRVLTIFSVIFIPLSFLAGVYGTNFDYLPELHLKYSYPVFWLVIITVVVVMLFVFKRKRWL